MPHSSANHEDDRYPATVSMTSFATVVVDLLQRVQPWVPGVPALIKRTWSNLARIWRQIHDLALPPGEPLAVPLEPVELSAGCCTRL
ncbi:MAG: hypothetical protein WCB92_04180 [Mycobacterium sp.]